jgi:hypothetical protein
MRLFTWHRACSINSCRSTSVMIFDVPRLAALGESWLLSPRQEPWPLHFEPMALVDQPKRKNRGSASDPEAGVMPRTALARGAREACQK